jgi:hypothetical protein
MSIAVDNRVVVLLKSRRTNNRFYTLVDPESGYKNADAIDDFPPEMPLGIAYPCLEDGLNDFAVIRTTFETIDVFPDDVELRTEMMAIIADARGNLVRRLAELRDRLVEGQAHFLGTDLQEFKDHILHMVHRGTIRRQLDSMMKVDVFESVNTANVKAGGSADPMYRYLFLPKHAGEAVEKLPPRDFIGRLFDDVLDSVTNDDNYLGKQPFDKQVFQKFIAVMFVNYATTDPTFYGTNRDDYGVSSDKDMTETPLYQAVATELRQLERDPTSGGQRPEAPARLEGLAAPEDLSALFGAPPDALDFQNTNFEDAGHTVKIPFGAAERMLQEPLTMLADAIRLLKHAEPTRVAELRRIAAMAGQQVFRGLQELEIISPLAQDPMADVLDT